jgi:hypothetical protein
MPSIDPERRRLLGALGGSLFALGGCLGGDDATPTATGTPARSETESPEPTDSPTATETESSTPVPQPDGWPMRFDGNVIAVDIHDGDLFALVVNEETSRTRLRALSPDGAVRWSTEFEADDHGHGPDEPDEPGWEWSTWATAEAVFLAAGMRHEWWAVRAFDRSDGTELWSFQGERRLAVRDVTADSLVVTGEEFFVPEYSHDTPEEPLVSEVYRLDRENGDATTLGRVEAARGAVADTDSAYVIAGSTLLALDDGGRRWSQSLTGEAFGVYLDDGTVVTVAENGDASRVSGFSTDGTRQWQRDGPESHSSDTLFVDGVVYVGGGDGVAAIRSDGTVAWRDSRPGGWFVHDDATGRIYSRSGRAADAATAYGPDGERLWTFDPDSRNAWPAGVTDDAVLATAITGDHASEPFYTMYHVDPSTGEGSPLVGLDTIFSVESVGSRAYVAAGKQINAYEPTPGG